MPRCAGSHARPALSRVRPAARRVAGRSAVARAVARPADDLRPLKTLGLTLLVALALALLAAGRAGAAEIADFVGSYKGKAQIASAGEMHQRDLSVEIQETREGFKVDWSTITYRADGRTKEAVYSINFVPSDRDEVYSAAMRKNMFGHDVQMDPMKGEPYVWARIIGDTMTVFSLFVDDQGGYEIQEFNRTLTEGGLDLDFLSVRNGAVRRRVETFLALE
ncbi:hypothetical protein [Marinibacterium sp. SX1]|uniref:hypothetical protein n=1 Tax=Marinibacterium sp. SX1 TaxID=3388424 RepID=UPI003D176311